MKKYSIHCLIVLLLSACNLEKDISLTLPDYQQEVVVESYLEAGVPVTMLLTYSTDFLEIPEDFLDIPVVKNANVILSDGNNDYALVYLDGDSLFQDDSIAGIAYAIRRCPQFITNGNYFGDLFERFIAGGKPFNYIVCDEVEITPGKRFTLTIETLEGEVITSSTTVLPPPEIVAIRQSTTTNNNKFFVTIDAFDDPSIDNYYRFLMDNIDLDSIFIFDSTNVDTIDIIEVNANSNVSASFSFEDDFFSSGKITVGSDYDFRVGDTVFARLYNIDEAYYDYLETQEAALQANFNPFALPASVKTNINGGLGIFTALSYDEKLYVVQ